MPALCLALTTLFCALPGVGGTTPLSLEVIQDRPVLSRIELRRALEQDLDRPVLFAEEHGTSAGVLTVQVEAAHRHVTLTWHPSEEPITVREATLPEGATEAIELTTLLAGNLVRREALAVAEVLEARAPQSAGGSMLPANALIIAHPEKHSPPGASGHLVFALSLGAGREESTAFAYDMSISYRWKYVAAGIDMAQLTTEAGYWTIGPAVLAQLPYVGSFRFEGGLGAGLAASTAPWDPGSARLDSDLSTESYPFGGAIDLRGIVKMDAPLTSFLDAFLRLELAVPVATSAYRPPGPSGLLTAGLQASVL